MVVSCDRSRLYTPWRGARADPNPQLFPQERGCNLTAPRAREAARTIRCTSFTVRGFMTPQRNRRWPHNDSTKPPGANHGATSLSKSLRELTIEFLCEHQLCSLPPQVTRSAIPKSRLLGTALEGHKHVDAKRIRPNSPSLASLSRAISYSNMCPFEPIDTQIELVCITNILYASYV
jgi:hypothetical protein